MVGQDRSLEVIVLAGRGLSAAVPAGGRRKVQITLVSTKDPQGEAFGAKVSPWTNTRQGRTISFGQSGLRCSFPLSGRRGAPSLAADARFPETACIRVRLLTSQVSTNSSVVRTAAAFLPTSVMDFASQEVDEATATIEAEMKVPLTNILSGRVGHAADRALGGWVPLRSCIEDEVFDPQVHKEEIPPALWMQMFVIPDHEALLPKLQEQLNAETAKLGQPAAAPAIFSSAMWASGGKGGSAQAVSRSPAQTAPPQRWGPPATATTANTQTQVVDDLIDVTLEDSVEPPKVGILDDFGSLLDGPTSSSSLPVASGFGFVQGAGQGYASSLPSMAPAPASGGTSAFGFIAGSSDGGAKLDLAALYASSEPPKAPSSAANYSAFSNLSDINFSAKPEPAMPKAPPKAAEGSLESLEASILADLKF